VADYERDSIGIGSRSSGGGRRLGLYDYGTIGTTAWHAQQQQLGQGLREDFVTLSSSCAHQVPWTSDGV